MLNTPPHSLTQFVEGGARYKLGPMLLTCCGVLSQNLLGWGPGTGNQSPRLTVELPLCHAVTTRPETTVAA